MTNDVVQMMTERICKLSPETQRMLSLAAAIGNRFDMNTLAAVAGQSIDKTSEEIWPAVKGMYHHVNINY